MKPRRSRDKLLKRSLLFLLILKPKLELKFIAIRAEIAAAEGGEDTNEGTDGQTITALIDHPSEQV